MSQFHFPCCWTFDHDFTLKKGRGSSGIIKKKRIGVTKELMEESEEKRPGRMIGSLSRGTDGAREERKWNRGRNNERKRSTETTTTKRRTRRKKNKRKTMVFE